MKNRLLSHLLVSLLFLPLLARATTYYSIKGGTISNTDWSLTDTNGHKYLCVTKPSPIGQTGMTEPWVDATQYTVTGTSSIGIRVDSNWPADSSSPALKKCNYRIVTADGTDPAAAGVKTQNDRFVGFWVYFDPNYELNNGTYGWPAQPIGTQLWQCWQGSGWPPLQLRTDESNGTIQLYFLMSNDHCRGSQNSYSSIKYLQDPVLGGNLVIQRGHWYPIIVECKFDYTSTSGVVNCWINGGLAVGWTGQVGYTPASVGGQSGTLDSCDSHFGIYEQATSAFHQVWYDNVKWADSYADANPGGFVTLPTTADSYVASNAATSNYGTATQILTKTGSPNRRGLVKFDTSSLPSGAVADSAVLTLYGNLSTSDTLSAVAVNCYGISDNSWTETGLTWNNQPTLGSSLSSTNVAKGSPTFWTWDATSFVNSQRAGGTTTISLAFANTTTSQQNCYFNSKEMLSNGPALTVYYH